MIYNIIHPKLTARRYNYMNTSIIKQPSAWIPIALSFAILGVMLIYITGFGPPQPEADEGLGAHLFQIWLALEALLIPFFAITWLPHAPRQALFILAIQIALVFAACFPVFYFGL